MDKIANPELVPQAVGTVLELREQVGVPLSTTLTRYLTRRDALIVFDNCEHLILAVAQLVETVLQGCPKVRALCTSREELKVPGEVGWRVPSLSVPAASERPLFENLLDYEAIKLFCERATTSTGSFVGPPIVM